ncbi:hypothetical protein XELAEV_18038616mg [Xenopus laevis]|uniref:Uncharacterized protein n=1 Tax=Xenopus laevis TaxID=8355 RepID=A0A974H7L8_XENLA|nr:hypothetical protein XELAEV_18038616mg [Xenopus laevis]
MHQQDNVQPEEPNTQQEPKLLTAQGSDPQSHIKQKRLTKPTWKVQENYEADKEELLRNISHLCNIQGVGEQHVARELLVGDHWSKTIECMSALSQPTQERHNTENSLHELKELNELNLERDDLVIQTRAKTDVKIAHLYDFRAHLSTTSKRSTRSSKSLRSTSSTLSQQLIKAQADAEASKIQAAFAQEKAQKKAEMESEAAQKKAEMEAVAAQKKAEMKAEAAWKNAQMEVLEKQCEHTKRHDKL